MHLSLVDYIAKRLHYELDVAHQGFDLAMARMEGAEFERGYVAGLERALFVVKDSKDIWDRTSDKGSTGDEDGSGDDGIDDGSGNGNDSGNQGGNGSIGDGTSDNNLGGSNGPDGGGHGVYPGGDPMFQ